MLSKTKRKMKRKIKVLSTFLLVSLFFYSGCATVSPPRIMLLKHAESSFKDYQFPSVEEIKNNSIASRQFSYTNYEDVWKALIKTLMQEGTLICLSRDKGIILVVIRYVYPFVFLAEELNPQTVKVYCALERNLLKKISNPRQEGITLSEKDQKEITKQLFYSISNQIYSSQKWNYLFGEDKSERSLKEKGGGER